jgi:hypothetical protein
VELDGPEGGGLDVNFELLDRGYQQVAAVGFASKHGREQPNHLRPPDWISLVKPGAVARDSHVGMTASIGIPLVDWWQASLTNERLEIVQAQTLKLDGRTAFGHRRPVVIAGRGTQ